MKISDDTGVGNGDSSGKTVGFEIPAVDYPVEHSSIPPESISNPPTGEVSEAIVIPLPVKKPEPEKEIKSVDSVLYTSFKEWGLFIKDKEDEKDISDTNIIDYVDKRVWSPLEKMIRGDGASIAGVGSRYDLPLLKDRIAKIEIPGSKYGTTNMEEKIRYTKKLFYDGFKTYMLHQLYNQLKPKVTQLRKQLSENSKFVTHILGEDKCSLISNLNEYYRKLDEQFTDSDKVSQSLIVQFRRWKEDLSKKVYLGIDLGVHRIEAVSRSVGWNYQKETSDRYAFEKNKLREKITKLAQQYGALLKAQEFATTL